jgi:tetratricopeptide (TPR) repeat protein
MESQNFIHSSWYILKIYAYFICAFFVLDASLFAQKKEKVIEKSFEEHKEYHFERYKSIYEMALRLNDFNIATMAVYEMLSLHPERNDLKDTLAMIYYAQKAYPKAIQLGEQILRETPNNRSIRELTAMAQDNQDMIEASLRNYQYLYENFGELYYLYKCATLEFFLKRFEECEANLNIIIQSPKALQETISISANQKDQQPQQIPMTAAAYNIKGIVNMEQEKFAEAKAYLQKALEISPDFKMALNNLEALKKRENSLKGE